MSLSPQYNPQEVENRIYKMWEKSGHFTPKIDAKIKPFVIMIPPPNVTGSLHMGHALNNTIIDILIRYKRMQGYASLYLPGTDHAGIATQNVVEKELAKEGLSRQNLGREKFIEKVWEWKEKYGNIILAQLKKLGCSCDWTRESFTMDPDYAEAVKFAFVKYFKDGLIYRGNRIVSWCTRCGTNISDIELEYQEEKGKLWFIKYQLKGSAKFITVATTRPETMLGDTAVAVNPKDKRYKDLIGKIVILPIVGREIPIVGDAAIDSKFGTGALKVTPAHDIADAEIGERNKLQSISVIGPDGKMTKEAGREFEGLEVLAAREKVLKKLEALNLLEKVEDYSHNVARCYRCHTIIEPLISKQWFVSMPKLAKLAQNAYEKEIDFIPKRWKKVAKNWLEDIHDWTISRQIWWGHRLPVYFCTSLSVIPKQVRDDNFVVAMEKPKICPICKKCQMKQSEDVLDTWFSSALWPMATLGWPKETEDFKYFYPTSILTTARDIIHLWVTRMVFSGLFFTEKIPFSKVLIHASVLNREGKRMSKSLGTGVDPLNLIEKYGADATRFGLILQASKTQDIRFGEDYLVAARNFTNKIWNIARFLEISGMNLQENEKEIKPKNLNELWILSRFAKIKAEVEKKIESYDFFEAANALYEFIWNDFADWYLESLKFENNDQGKKIASFVFSNSLRILHPFMPFITEEIFQRFGNQILISSRWPKSSFKRDLAVEKEFGIIQELTKLMRSIRSQYNISPNVEFEVLLLDSKNSANFLKQRKLIEKFAKIKLTLKKNKNKIKGSLPFKIGKIEGLIILEGKIDFAKELEKTKKEINNVSGYLKGIEIKLKNKKYLASAPREVIAKDKENAAQAADKLLKLREFEKAISSGK